MDFFDSIYKILLFSVKDSDILSNLEALVSNIYDAKHTAGIMETYKLASSQLKKSYEESGLTAEKADDTLADIKEVRKFILRLVWLQLIQNIL